MESASVEIVRCSPECVAEALAVVLCEIAPSQRQEIAGGLLDGRATELAGESLYVALRGERLCGAAWGQRQPGNAAVFWPPQLAPGEDERTAYRLAEAVVRELDDKRVEMTQSLLPAADAEAAPVLLATGFLHLADLLYMSCEADRFPAHRPASRELEFEAYEESQRNRLMRIVERTYQGTHDCPALNGARSLDDVIDGYQRTGVFRPENWLIVRSGKRDVGVLLLADHPAAQHWELVYMGLLPEARGRGWGAQIAQYAKWLARVEGVERIVLAVDAANEPALRMYGQTGFEMWDRRSVYVRFPAKSQA